MFGALGQNKLFPDNHSHGNALHFLDYPGMQNSQISTDIIQITWPWESIFLYDCLLTFAEPYGDPCFSVTEIWIYIKYITLYSRLTEPRPYQHRTRISNLTWAKRHPRPQALIQAPGRHGNNNRHTWLGSTATRDHPTGRQLCLQIKVSGDL